MMKRTAQKGSSPVRAGWPGLYQALGRMAAVGSKAAARPWRKGLYQVLNTFNEKGHLVKVR